MKRILVVDDERAILDALEICLQESGYEVSVIQDSKTVYSAVERVKPDLILLDVLLAGADGRDIAKQLKSNARTKPIPIILMSAHPSAVKSVVGASVQAFLPKPFEMEQLEMVIERCLH
jgi:DNA-binding response OmpR family regulator